MLPFALLSGFLYACKIKEPIIPLEIKEPVYEVTKRSDDLEMLQILRFVSRHIKATSEERLTNIYADQAAHDLRLSYEGNQIGISLCPERPLEETQVFSAFLG